MTEYKIIKGKQVQHLEGELLSSNSSFLPGKENWTDIEIYKTITNEYVIVTYGRTTKEKQKEMVKITKTPDPRGVIEALKRPGKYSTKYLTNGADLAVQEAAEKDKGLNDAYYNFDLT